MDLFGPVNVKSIGDKYYCLVITDDYSRFSWVFFLGSNDETTSMLLDFFSQVENIFRTQVKRIRSDNGTEFKNSLMSLYCFSKGIEHQFSAPYEPQQNGVAERKNRTLIEAARTMLADSKLPVIFWGEAVNTACHVLNRVLIVKRFHKTCYELLNNRKPNLTGYEPFGVPCTILKNKIQSKFGEKADEGLFLGYMPSSPNKRVYNNTSGRVEIAFNIEVTSYTPVKQTGSDWLFHYDAVLIRLIFHFHPMQVLLVLNIPFLETMKILKLFLARVFHLPSMEIKILELDLLQTQLHCLQSLILQRNLLQRLQKKCSLLPRLK